MNNNIISDRQMNAWLNMGVTIEDANGYVTNSMLGKAGIENLLMGAPIAYHGTKNGISDFECSYGTLSIKSTSSLAKMFRKLAKENKARISKIAREIMRGERFATELEKAFSIEVGWFSNFDGTCEFVILSGGKTYATVEWFGGNAFGDFKLAAY